jgi:WhiB family redox-sensing transcriptional regulator
MGRRPDLPGLVAWAWQEQAACAQLDTRLFFHRPGESGNTLEGGERAAERVCAACPVQAHCREYVLECAEEYGVWGGLGESERAQARTRRRQAARAALIERNTSAA